MLGAVRRPLVLTYNFQFGKRYEPQLTPILFNLRMEAKTHHSVVKLGSRGTQVHGISGMVGGTINGSISLRNKLLYELPDIMFTLGN